MDRFLPSIKQKYKDRLINREKQWPPCHSNKLVRLELVEREKGKGYCHNIQRGSDDKTVNKRTPLAYGDLFKVESDKKPVRKVLVEGDAGIGKTTLSVSISEDWSCEKLFKEFELVLLLPLRYKKVASAGSLPELLKLLHPSSDVCKSVASYLEEEEAKKVLVIADGWDELSETERQEGSFLYDILFETFPLMSVVVTSRPSASTPFRKLPCIDRFVEINGFGKDDIKEYIHCEFSSEHEKACRLLEQLEDNPIVESVCSVPLNCAIVCHLWRTSEKTLPSTMTQLYTKMILNVILRNIKKKDAFKSVLSLPNFDALPNELQQSFRLLCEFAFKALKKNQIVFCQGGLAEFFPEWLALDENILCFGLLQSAETVLETGHGISFHFLHLTIMEYLAALHFSEQPHSTLLKMFSPMLNDPSSSLNLKYQFKFNCPFGESRSNIVWRFFYGIFFSGSGKESKKVGISIFKYLAEVRNSSRLNLCHCAFESQNDSIVHEAIQSVQKRPRLQYGPLRNFGYLRTAHDFAAVLYVMTKMKECSDMTLDLSCCGLRENQIRRFTDILASKEGKLRVAELCLDGNKLTGECVSDLFHRASAAFKPDTCTSTPSTRNGLITLDLSYNFLRASDLESLEYLVRDRFFANLRYLNLEGCLTGDAHTNATVMTTFIEALSTNCPFMDELNTSSNNLGVPGASAVAKRVSRFQKYLRDSVSHYFDGFKLHLDRNSLGDEGLKAFVDNLDGVYNFRKLSLSDNSIHAAGVSYLVESVCSGRIVMSKKNPFYELFLDDNQLGQKGTIEVCKMLVCSRCRFATIHLRRCTLCRLTTAGYASSNTDSVSLSNSVSCESIGQQLCQMPKKYSIRCLCLDGNNFSGDGIHILIGIMHICTQLVDLNCSDCGITSDDFILFLDKIIELKSSSPNLCSQLDSWDLRNNKLDDSGVTALINHLPALFGNPSSLRNVPSVNGNLVSNAVRTRLAEKVSSLCKEVR